MGFAIQVRPLVTLRADRRRHWALLAAILALVFSNILSNRVLPEWAYVPWNVGMAFVLLGIAAQGGAGPIAVGLGIRHWHRPVGVGLLLAGGMAVIYALGLALPTFRDAFLDSRVADASTAQMVWVVLVQIPLGTVLLEEIAFRGVLPALMGAAPSIRWRWGPVLGSSLLFGCWHILPSIGMNKANAAIGDALGSDQRLTTVLAVLSTLAVGVGLCGIARLGKGVKTSILFHWGTNSLAFFAAWLVLQ